ncbi:MAG: ADP-glyceromanno-heptose 6-epimerase [Candidatus Eisenbacteria bacterium]|uniref:ADP-L-glycero-D-manno-heptose-6-epimerase n=1 Tax=Eiseniibacteriota bacterium TaxID=2212470 RepID=A0A849SBC3_UNCEI|nr:ADP-glyceromanno-heptose 6-epimerase [Candidatus Eisenbacteria bacterium]
MIAVTGAAGFIGSVLVWRFNQLGERNIVCVDTRASAQDSANLAPLTYREYIPHEAFLQRLTAGEWRGELQCVFHLGACSSTTETDWDYLQRNNIEYSQSLCEAALAAGARFIHASSAATYGNGDHGYSDDHARLHELMALNLYGRSKQLFDLWALDRGLLDRIVALKYFNVYGPNEWHKGSMRSMVCKGFEQIRDTGQVRLFKSDRAEYPDGGQKRDFIYVKDAVDMTLWFRDHPHANGVFNVGTGQAADWNRLLTAVFTALGREPRIEYIDMPAELIGSYQYFTQAEMTKLHAAGYRQPLTPLEDAVADYVRQHLVNGRHLGA